MFRGISSINMDAKGRITMPTRYREGLDVACENQLVMTIDTDDPCLLLYPLPEWEAIERKIEALPSFNKATRRIQRLLIGHATEANLDGHGKMLVVPELRTYAKLEKKVILVGQGKKFELWSDEQWQQRRTEWLEENSDDELPQELQSLSL